MKGRRLRAYLAGRMDFSNPYHRQWRTDITPFLKKLDFVPLNPYLLEPNQLKGLRPGRMPTGSNYTHWTEFGDSNDPILEERFRRYIRRIIDFDIDLVEKEADFLIVYWDEHCQKGAGTHSEMTVAYRNKKEIYCVCDPKVEMPVWARGCCTLIFDSFDNLRKFLIEEFGDGDTEKAGKTDTKITKEDPN